MSQKSETHIVVVSNRGPFSFTLEEGKTRAEKGSGGLVTAISAVARENNILWISCALSKGDRQWLSEVGDGVQALGDMKIKLVIPDARAYNAYYNIISNPLLWFVQHEMHDTPRHPVIDETVWKAWRDGYHAINRQLARAVADAIQGLEGRIIVMPQDYHLYLLPHYLRELVGNRIQIQTFLHIPWPGSDAWRVLPLSMRTEILESLLKADRLGFQTERDTRRFLQTCVDTLSGVRVIRPWRCLAYRDRQVEAQPFPISIDAKYLESRLESPEVQVHLEDFRRIYAGKKLILRVDRVEPSKNILRGFMAYQNLLTSNPEYRGKVGMLALLVPSRMEVMEYKHYLRDITSIVGEINATLGDSEWEPIRLLLGNNYDRAIAALSMYDVLLVNPLTDGMNLVAKEGGILNRNGGVLILSEEAGAAEELGENSLLVSPYDVFGTRQAILEALNMPVEERSENARRLREYIQVNDIHRWFSRQIEEPAS